MQIGVDRVGQVKSGNQLTQLALITGRTTAQLIKSSEIGQKISPINQAQSTPGIIGSNRNWFDQQLAKSQINPIFELGLSNKQATKKGVGLTAKRGKNTDPARLNRKQKPSTDKRRKTATRAAISNREAGHLGNNDTKTTQLEREIGKRIRSPGSQSDELARKRFKDTEREIVGDDERGKGITVS